MAHIYHHPHTRAQAPTQTHAHVHRRAAAPALLLSSRILHLTSDRRAAVPALLCNLLRGGGGQPPRPHLELHLLRA